jgi:NAD(P)-dependent dehydrogenase (short-subunit alcohol dehydrogenase family)
MNSHYRNLFELNAKTAVVTGAMGILGQRFCRGLAEFGAQVVAVDLVQDRCTAFAADLERDYSVPALGVACDVSDAASVADMVDQVVKHFGAIHILHNNAASKSADLDAFFATTEEYSLNEWRRIMSVNVDGMFLVAQAVGGQMQKQGTGGSIIQTEPQFTVCFRRTNGSTRDPSTSDARSATRLCIQHPKLPLSG